MHVLLNLHAMLNIAGLTLLKIAIALPVLSYIEHTRQAAASIQHHCVVLSANPFCRNDVHAPFQ